MLEAKTPNAIFSVAWSEGTPDVISAACGDGVLRIFKIGTPAPVGEIRAHKKEVNSVECSHFDPVRENLEGEF